MDYKKTMELAVEAIQQGTVTEQDTVLYGKVCIRKTTPTMIQKTVLHCTKNGLDYCTQRTEQDIYYISVGKPNTHWLEEDYYIVYEK